MSCASGRTLASKLNGNTRLLRPYVQLAKNRDFTHRGFVGQKTPSGS